MAGITIDERREALSDRFPVWSPRTLDSWLDDCAERHGERPFVITDARTLSYADVAAESQRIAAGLQRLGVCPGDHVGLLMSNRAEFVTLKFAIARVGAVAVPFNFLYRAEELRYVVEQSACVAVVTGSGYGDIDHLAILDEIAPGWDDPSMGGDRPLPGWRHLRHVVHVPAAGEEARPGAVTGSDLEALGQGPAVAAPVHRPDDVADLLYTSGSTGSPKGVQVTHDAVLRTAYASALTRAYEDGRRILFSLPCYHMFGYVEGLLSAMFVGGSVVMLPAFSAEAYLRAVERHRVTDLLCVPTMAVALVESSLRHEVDLSSLTAVLCGSAPAPVWLWEQVERDFGVSEIVTGYGMTECGGAMTLTLPEDDLVLTSTTVGRPKLAGAAGVPTAPTHRGLAPLTTYRTVDPASGNPLPSGEGELVSCGPTTMLGYFAKPDETEAALREHPDGSTWLHSGDLGRIDERGYLVLTGRSKEVYKSGGELVMPKEVEEVLAAHPGVSQAFAVGLTDERWGEIGCAVVVRAPAAPGATVVDEAELIAHAKQHLARFKVPKRVVFVAADQLPTTATGKVQKFRLGPLVAELDTSEGEPS
ncbi:class I adenylate-forming enzyme family protein [Nocardioides sp.]|uniref:class I adenylate-forming enzyme family protein n=1 Tax=Nocardioides sp. TaxID=35761 RepID=UPI003511F902